MKSKTSFITLALFICAAFSNECPAQDSTKTWQDSAAVNNRSQEIKKDTVQVNKDKQLQEFRKAFDKVMNAKKKKVKQKKKVEEDPSLDLGVFIADETRTKMGRDFYSLFYQNWQAPDSTSNFTITISEQPSPGLGSLVSINIDNSLVFKARLQPRYDYIAEVSKQAVARCQQIVAQKEKVRKQLSGF